MFAKFYTDELKKCPDCGQYVYVDSTGRGTWPSITEDTSELSWGGCINAHLGDE